MEATAQQQIQMIAERKRILELNRFVTDAQLLCQSKCEQNLQGEEERLMESTRNLSAESEMALEKQCNKMCLHKMMQAFLFADRLSTL
jgi:hypothetical protein